MKNGKYQNRGVAKRGANKSLAVLLALVLVLGCAIGGTIAWLTDTTDVVKNTFTVGNINIDLDESDNLDLKMVPGDTIDKDPEVTVEANSEACWLFVKIDEVGPSGTIDEKPVSYTFGDFLSYEIADGWIPLTDTDNDGVADDGVYYRQIDANTAKAGATYSVLKGDKVTVEASVTKDMMDNLQTFVTNQETNPLPTLTFTAYAIQSANLKDAEGNAANTAAAAWALVNAN